MVTDVVVKAEIYIDNNNDKICTYIYSAKFKIKLARIAVISWAKFYGYVILCYWLCNLRHSYWWNILCNCRQKMLLAVGEKSCQRRFFEGHFYCSGCFLLKGMLYYYIYSGLFIIISQNSSKSMDPEPSSSSSSIIPSSSSSTIGSITDG